MCGGHGVLPTWSSLGTSWTGWVRVRIPDGYPVVLKNFPSWQLKRTALLVFSRGAWMAWTSPSSILKLLRTCHMPACQTLSNAFLKFMKLQNRSCWCCRCFSVMTWLLKICSTVLWICSTVLWPGLKPACSSASSSSTLALSQLRITWSWSCCVCCVWP